MLIPEPLGNWDNKTKYNLPLSISLSTRLNRAPPPSQSLGDCVRPVIIKNLRLGLAKRAANGLMATHLISAFPMVVNAPNQYLEGLLGIPQSKEHIID